MGQGISKSQCGSTGGQQKSGSQKSSKVFVVKGGSRKSSKKTVAKRSCSRKCSRKSVAKRSCSRKSSRESLAKSVYNWQSGKSSNVKESKQKSSVRCSKKTQKSGVSRVLSRTESHKSKKRKCSRSGSRKTRKSASVRSRHKPMVASHKRNTIRTRNKCATNKKQRLSSKSVHAKRNMKSDRVKSLRYSPLRGTSISKRKRGTSQRSSKPKRTTSLGRMSCRTQSCQSSSNIVYKVVRLTKVKKPQGLGRAIVSRDGRKKIIQHGRPLQGKTLRGESKKGGVFASKIRTQREKLMVSKLKAQRAKAKVIEAIAHQMKIKRAKAKPVTRSKALPKTTNYVHSKSKQVVSRKAVFKKQLEEMGRGPVHARSWDTINVSKGKGKRKNEKLVKESYLIQKILTNMHAKHWDEMNKRLQEIKSKRSDLSDDNS